MRGITFNKLSGRVLCQYCKINRVPASKWNQRCQDCKMQTAEATIPVNVKVGEHPPVAVVESLQDRKKIFVDKKGREVKDHGYDLENDPRGWVRNRRAGKSTLI